VLLLVSTAALSWPVYADTVSIGLVEGAGSPTTVASGTGNATFNGPFGTFSNLHIDGAGQSELTLTDMLFSNNIDTATAAGGTLSIFVTDQGLTQPIGTLPFTSSFTSNLLPSGWTLTESTFVSSANALYSGTPLSSANFSAIGTNVQTASAATGAGPYSVTEEFVIRATGAGDANNTIDLSATPTPEPTVLVVLGCGLLGLGVLKRRG
jgi:hypothetical protein